MTEQWRRLESIFEDALQRPVSERDAYLREVCADDVALYRELSALLAHHQDNEGEPAWAADAAVRVMSRSTRLQHGDRLGRYEIDSFIAAGGMGDVYKAIDTRLNRHVAVKRLNGTQNDRFDQEAHALAALNHSNICQIHDVGPDYLVFEYVNGTPMHGPLPVDEALRLAIQVADAIQSAHARGILHRDLKPANILVTRAGAAKVLDFGLAKIMSDDIDVTRTMEGVIVGTACYMSPEQAECRTLDVRTDIFSFGAILYEMLSGRRAFHGETTAQVLSAVLRDEPPQLRTTIGSLDQLIVRCLAKDRSQRPQTMADVKEGLEQIERERALSASVSPTKFSIAVLPFADMSAGRDQEWFSDGLTEEIINALVQVPGLRVIARTSAFAFKGKQRDIRRIGEALGVGHLLEGSVRRAGDRVRITAQLIAATDGGHLWSKRYDRDVADVFAIQDDVARNIAKTMEVKLSVDPESRRHYTPSVEAYESYLKASYEFERATLGFMARLHGQLDRAIALDSAFAAPHALRGYVYWLGSVTSRFPAHDMIPKAKASLLKALEIDPELPHAHAVLGLIAFAYDFERLEAERHFRQVDAQPLNMETAFTYVNFLTFAGRAHEAIQRMRSLLLQDPLSPGAHHMLAFALDIAGAHAEAELLYKRTLEVYELAFYAAEGLAINQISMGRLDQALVAAERAHKVAPWNSSSVAILAGLRKRTGDVAAAEALVSQFGDGSQYGAPIGYALYHALCDQPGPAAEWLEKAIAQRDPRVFVFLHLPPGKVWQASSRWPAIARLLNLP